MPVHPSFQDHQTNQFVSNKRGWPSRNRRRDPHTLECNKKNLKSDYRHRQGNGEEPEVMSRKKGDPDDERTGQVGRKGVLIYRPGGNCTHTLGTKTETGCARSRVNQLTTHMTFRPPKSTVRVPVPGPGGGEGGGGGRPNPPSDRQDTQPQGSEPTPPSSPSKRRQEEQPHEPPRGPGEVERNKSSSKPPSLASASPGKDPTKQVPRRASDARHSRALQQGMSMSPLKPLGQNHQLPSASFA
ncbi:hypothetical protein F5144DRAFT_139016 [Chaetomium tenue]|uniref:Uncharacterized protein n=1 Tax=Chaetomium tenue TaxID=1854479 RepID=A0ACB7PMJ0_9PEZI|nr:hypothetical protein F5144DRAFT_139016 [Chaetomium globosum]